MFICVFYIPPTHTNNSEIISQHCDSLSWISSQMKPNDSILIIGDFNLPCLRWTLNPAGFFIPDAKHSTINSTVSQLLDDYSIANLGQLCGIQNNYGNVLDLCFTSIGMSTSCNLTQAPSPLLRACRFHQPLLVPIECRVHAFRDTSSQFFYDYRRGNFQGMNEFLKNVDWNHLLADRDANSAAVAFTEVVLRAINIFIPKKLHLPACHPAWSNDQLKRLKTQKRAALKKFNKHPTRRWKVQYNSINRKYSRLNNTLFLRYQRRIQHRLKQNPKQFWNHVNSQRKETGLPSVMELDSREASSPIAICELFRSQFSSVFTNEDLDDITVQQAASNVPDRDTIAQHPLVDPDTVSRTCSALKYSTSSGPDGIPAAVLKSCSDSLALPLSKLFNISLKSGVFPLSWKKSYIFPVHKKGPKRNVRNYRGIAALRVVSKLIVPDHIKLNCNNYIAQEQHGFMPKRSTCSNLVAYTSFISQSMQKRQQVDAIYTDLSAAFDKINHRIAFAKLERLGFCGSFLKWLCSYLSDREMCVKIGDVLSAVFAVFSGVPQGSHLGPIIYLLYMNDVHLLLKCHKLSYADDIKLFAVINSSNDALLLQDQLNIFAHWCDDNRMVLNASKCSVITFTRKRSTISFDYNLSNTSLSRSSSIKDLGVVLDCQLSFIEHISYTVSKASKVLGFVFRVAKHFRQVSCLKALYCSLVRSTLEYCSVVWAPFYQNGIERIEKVQRKFTRYALRHIPLVDPLNPPSYADRCNSLGLDLLSVRRDVAKAIFVSDLLKSSIDCPEILEQVNFYIQRRTIRSHQFIRIPRASTNYGRNAAVSSMCRVFNDCYVHFDFHLSRNVLRKLFLNHFKT